MFRMRMLIPNSTCPPPALLCSNRIKAVSCYTWAASLLLDFTHAARRGDRCCHGTCDSCARGHANLHKYGPHKRERTCPHSGSFNKLNNGYKMSYFRTTSFCSSVPFPSTRTGNVIFFLWFLSFYHGSTSQFFFKQPSTVFNVNKIN